MNTELAELVDYLRRNVFVDQAVVSKILDDVSAQRMSEADATRQLRHIEVGARQGPLALSQQEVKEEWAALLAAMADEARDWQKIARRQFAQGFIVLPVLVGVVIGVLLYLSITLPSDQLALTAQPLLGACLAAVATHAFLVFRVHQQARVAAERLSEKRAAILFMRIAIDRADPQESAQLLQAGTAMFLGHHAMQATPLQPGDKPSVPAVPPQRNGSSKR